MTIWLCPSIPVPVRICRLGRSGAWPAPQAAPYSMIRKSGYRFSEKIMLKQEAKAKW
jgi:hypothetical protein